jgi:hypothetical protein
VAHDIWPEPDRVLSKKTLAPTCAARLSVGAEDAGAEDAGAEDVGAEELGVDELGAEDSGAEGLVSPEAEGGLVLPPPPQAVSAKIAVARAPEGRMRISISVT